MYEKRRPFDAAERPVALMLLTNGARNGSSVLLWCAAAVLLLTAPGAFSSEENLLDAGLSDGNNSFAFKMYNELRSSEGNIFFSPWSVSSALAMTYSGARGNTAAEMRKALDFRLEQKQLPTAFKNLNSELMSAAGRSGQKLNIANGLCLTGGEPGGEYKALLKEDYDAEIFPGGLSEINGWVRRKTEGKIEKILESLDANSAFVILNAIYFKGTWDSQFKKSDTHNAPFKLAGGKEITVPLMFQKSRYRTFEKQGFQAISIPYKGKGMSMVILLPARADGLPGLEKLLTWENVKSWLAELDGNPELETLLSLPRFRMDKGYDLVPHFKALGMKEAFDAGVADFGGMGFKKGALSISQIRHKAFADVNEEGTEAAAATAVEMKVTCVPRYPVFCADHPFIFIIRDTRTGSILFIGRLADPSKQN